jgi:putative protein-disulfide isomerase
MDSWSFGFAPEISRIKSAYQEVLEFGLVMGGLRTSETQPLDEPSKDGIAHLWHQVNERTGQEFNFSLFNKENFVYNTEPACRAMVVVRHLRHEAEFEIFQALQYAFFHEMIDITQVDSLVDVLLPFQIQEQDFLPLFHSGQIREETQQDFDFASGIGARLIPSVYLESEGQVHKIARGYRTFEDMQPIIDRTIHQVRVR